MEIAVASQFDRDLHSMRRNYAEKYKGAPVRCGFEAEFASSLDHDDFAEELQIALGINRSSIVVNKKYGSSHGGDYRYWSVESDSSITTTVSNDYQLELVSPILPLPQMLSSMEKVFNLLNSKTGGYTVGLTNSSCGCHMTFSLQDINLRAVNIVKLYLFLGEKYWLTVFGREETSYAKSIQDAIAAIFRRCARMPVDKAVSEIKEMNFLGDNPGLDEIFKDNQGENRTNTINITKLFHDNPDKRCIELRLPGGENYSHKYNMMARIAERFAYALWASVTDEYSDVFTKKIVKELEKNNEAKRVASTKITDVPAPDGFSVAIASMDIPRMKALTFKWKGGVLDSIEAHPDFVKNAHRLGEAVLSKLLNHLEYTPHNVGTHTYSIQTSDLVHIRKMPDNQGTEFNKFLFSALFQVIYGDVPDISRMALYLRAIILDHKDRHSQYDRNVYDNFVQYITEILGDRPPFNELINQHPSLLVAYMLSVAPEDAPSYRDGMYDALAEVFRSQEEFALVCGYLGLPLVSKPGYYLEGLQTALKTEPGTVHVEPEALATLLLCRFDYSAFRQIEHAQGPTVQKLIEANATQFSGLADALERRAPYYPGYIAQSFSEKGRVHVMQVAVDILTMLKPVLTEDIVKVIGALVAPVLSAVQAPYKSAIQAVPELKIIPSHLLPDFGVTFDEESVPAELTTSNFHLVIADVIDFPVDQAQKFFNRPDVVDFFKSDSFLRDEGATDSACKLIAGTACMDGTASRDFLLSNVHFVSSLLHNDTFCTKQPDHTMRPSDLVRIVQTIADNCSRPLINKLVLNSDVDRLDKFVWVYLKLAITALRATYAGDVTEQAATAEQASALLGPVAINLLKACIKADLFIVDPQANASGFYYHLRDPSEQATFSVIKEVAPHSYFMDVMVAWFRQYADASSQYYIADHDLSYAGITVRPATPVNFTSPQYQPAKYQHQLSDAEHEHRPEAQLSTEALLGILQLNPDSNSFMQFFRAVNAADEHQLDELFAKLEEGQGQFVFYKTAIQGLAVGRFSTFVLTNPAVLKAGLKNKAFVHNAISWLGFTSTIERMLEDTPRMFGYKPDDWFFLLSAPTTQVVGPIKLDARAFCGTLGVLTRFTNNPDAIFSARTVLFYKKLAYAGMTYVGRSNAQASLRRMREEMRRMPDVVNHNYPMLNALIKYGSIPVSRLNELF